MCILGQQKSKNKTHNTWQYELDSALNSLQSVHSFFESDDLKLNHLDYPVFIPQSFAKKIKAKGKSSPLWKQFIPDSAETNLSLLNQGKIDPIGDKINYSSNQLIHRYQNRALFLPTSDCAIKCRYCFRKNEIIQNSSIFSDNFSETLKYLKNNPNINEIIFSGGDPLVLNDSTILKQLSLIKKEAPSIKYLRFHTRMPLIIPSRVTNDFLSLLQSAVKMFTKVNFVIHINHQEELDKEVIDSLNKINSTNVNLLSQTVLLCDVNDNVEALQNLFYSLIDINIRPYYLHFPDQVRGGMHFYLDFTKATQITNKLRQTMPGWALPQLVVDSPEGKKPEHLTY